MARSSNIQRCSWGEHVCQARPALKAIVSSTPSAPRKVPVAKALHSRGHAFSSISLQGLPFRMSGASKAGVFASLVSNASGSLAPAKASLHHETLEGNQDQVVPEFFWKRRSSSLYFWAIFTGWRPSSRVDTLRCALDTPGLQVRSRLGCPPRQASHHRLIVHVHDVVCEVVGVHVLCLMLEPMYSKLPFSHSGIGKITERFFFLFLHLLQNKQQTCQASRFFMPKQKMKQQLSKWCWCSLVFRPWIWIHTFRIFLTNLFHPSLGDVDSLKIPFSTSAHALIALCAASP